MEIDLRWPALLLTSIILLIVVRALNDLADLHQLHLSVGALYLLLPGLLLRMKGALFLVAIIALLLDAFNPYLFGFHLVVFSIFVTIVFLNRQALFRANRRQTLSVLLLINLGLILLENAIFGYQWLGYRVYWQRIFCDLILSELCLIPLGYWFINFQNWALRLVGCDMAPLED